MMTNDNSQPPRLVIYGTGNYGSLVTRLADKKGWPIVAAFNRAGDKIGQDLGRLAGLNKDLGVTVQDCDSADYGQLDADVAIVATTNTMTENLPVYERLLGAGLNVICHSGGASYPQLSDPVAAEKIEKLARSNNVSFLGSSVWDFSRIWSGILALGPCVEVSSIQHSTLTNVNYPSLDIARQMCLDLSVEEFQEKMSGVSLPLGKIYCSIVEQVVRKAGLTVTKRTDKVLPATLEQPVYSLAYEREIAAGRVVGNNIAIELETAEGARVSGNFAVRILTDNEAENFRWDIEGTPSNSLVVERKDAELASAACMLNRAPDIIPAAPGIRLVSELGPLTPNLS